MPDIQLGELRYASVEDLAEDIEARALRGVTQPWQVTVAQVWLDSLSTEPRLRRAQSRALWRAATRLLGRSAAPEVLRVATELSGGATDLALYETILDRLEARDPALTAPLRARLAQLLVAHFPASHGRLGPRVRAWLAADGHADARVEALLAADPDGELLDALEQAAHTGALSSAVAGRVAATLARKQPDRVLEAATRIRGGPEAPRRAFSKRVARLGPTAGVPPVARVKLALGFAAAAPVPARPTAPPDPDARLVLDLSGLGPRRRPSLATAVGKALRVLPDWGLTTIVTPHLEGPLDLDRKRLNRAGQRSAEIRDATDTRAVSVHLFGGEVNLKARCPLEPGALAALRALRARWLAAWPKTATAPREQQLRIIQHRYRRPLPPRGGYPTGCLQHWFDASAVQGRFGADAWQRLCSAPLPEGTKRREDGQTLAVSWVEALPAPDLDARLLASDVWVGQALHLPRAKDFLANGDQEHRPVAGASPPFALYDGASRVGYVDLPSHFDDADLKPFLALKHQGRTNGGAPLDSLAVVFERREDAWTAYKRLRALGVWRVLYRAADGRLANPHPPGRWRDIFDWWDAEDGAEGGGLSV